jgi:glyoxylase-like metal-dependent hydrolase (beta-lactamase superfamily II)
MLLFKFPFGPLKTNALLLGCSETKKAAVIDPALGSSDAVLEKAEEMGLSIDKILLTHSHWDHFADAQNMKEKTGAPVYVHALDAENLRTPGSDGLPLLFPLRSVDPDHFFVDGERFKVGHLNIEVIHTPGHSPGGVCFYVPAHHLLISGDTLFQGCMGGLHLPTANADEMKGSLKKLSLLPPDTRVVPGHGPDTTIGKESWLKKFNH